MKTAKLVKNLKGYTGKAKLYRVSPPLDGHRLVVVSATIAPFTGPETYIFPANKDGEVTNWGELTGSYRGGLSHEKALREAGYEVVDG